MLTLEGRRRQFSAYFPVSATACTSTSLTDGNILIQSRTDRRHLCHRISAFPSLVLPVTARSVPLPSTPNLCRV
jgi:hypothetical protein